eukprot:GEZU01022886.1.p2 GENE.GEZU01022886.1~~GEZU01022886.1.p2  ORF type:complete len:323 (-),score=82.81 GEZU01022886.1:85-1053(-)
MSESKQHSISSLSSSSSSGGGTSPPPSFAIVGSTTSSSSPTTTPASKTRLASDGDKTSPLSSSSWQHGSGRQQQPLSPSTPISSSQNMIRRKSSSSSSSPVSSTSSSSSESLPSSPSFNILVVDDNLINLKVAVNVVKQVLNQQKKQRSNNSPDASLEFSIDTAKDGIEAIEKATGGKKRYTLIFMDIHMPRCDGIKATRKIKAALAHPQQQHNNDDRSSSSPIPDTSTTTTTTHQPSTSPSPSSSSSSSSTCAWGGTILPAIYALTADTTAPTVQKCIESGMENNVLGKPLQASEANAIIESLRKQHFSLLSSSSPPPTLR